MKILIVSGLSGAGKSVALNTLEDEGYYCIDNLPIAMIDQLSVTIQSMSRIEQYSGIAVGIDARNDPESLEQIEVIKQNLIARGFDVQTIFLTCASDVLLRRFSETRRRHPLTSAYIDINQALTLEDELLEPLERISDLIIDTSNLNLHDLRTMLISRLMGKRSANTDIHLQSFGFKHGLPSEADFVFDVRHLPNPHWVPSLRPLTGLDQPIVDYLSSKPNVTAMIDSIAEFISTQVPEINRQGRAYLNVCIGCTGGRHRSVFIANSICQRLQTALTDNTVQIIHRDKDRRKAG